MYFCSSSNNIGLLQCLTLKIRRINSQNYLLIFKHSLSLQKNKISARNIRNVDLEWPENRGIDAAGNLRVGFGALVTV